VTQQQQQKLPVLAPKKFMPTPYQYHTEVKVEVKSLSSEGYGVAVDLEHPERSILVPKVWPGETVTARIHRNHRGHSDADLVRIDVPSPERITPRCPYFSSCSGCQFQHVPISAQHAWKKRHVLSVLTAAGCDLNSAQICEVASTGSEHTFHYRSKITPQVSYQRKKPTRDLAAAAAAERPLPETYSDRNLKVGFSRIDNRDVLDITECLLATKAVNDQYVAFRKELMATHAQNSSSGAATPVSKKRRRLLSSRLFRDDMSGGGVESDPNAHITQEVGGLRFTYKAGELTDLTS
jgi:tRNA/tmRNA/rRNA uracil-C5-methylase (TrmA/RlmC/RlmD family)